MGIILETYNLKNIKRRIVKQYRANKLQLSLLNVQFGTQGASDMKDSSGEYVEMRNVAVEAGKKTWHRRLQTFPPDDLQFDEDTEHNMYCHI